MKHKNYKQNVLYWCYQTNLMANSVSWTISSVFTGLVLQKNISTLRPLQSETQAPCLMHIRKFVSSD